MNRLEHGLGSEVALLSLEDVDVVSDDLLVLRSRSDVVVGFGHNSVHQVEQFSESALHLGSVNSAQFLDHDFVEQTGSLLSLNSVNSIRFASAVKVENLRPAEQRHWVHRRRRKAWPRPS